MDAVRKVRVVLNWTVPLCLVTCMAALACLFTGAAAANWHDELASLRSAQDAAEVSTWIARILDANPPWHEVVDELRTAPFTTPDSVGLAFVDSIRCRDDVVRPYAVYLPSDYDPLRPTPLLVYLHGGVSRSELPDDPLGYVSEHPYVALAEEQGWVAIFPMGQGGATWWDKIGIENVLSQVRTTKARYNIDDDRVWMSGFSDGASGAFGFAMLRPSTFSAFVPLNGHMGVPNLSGDLPTFAGNLAGSPLHVVNTDLDGLYPAAKMRRTIKMASDAGADIRYREYHGIRHEFAYADEELPRIARFLKRHPRDPFPAAIDWEAADTDFGRCHWLQIDRIVPTAPAPWHTDINAVLTDERISIGFHADDSFAEEGVQVASLADGETLARDMRLLAGDVIIRGGGERIRDLEALNVFKATVARGDVVQLTVMRDGHEKVLEGRLPEVRTYYLFKREHPPAAVRARFCADRLTIEGSRLGGLTFWVHPDMVQLEQELVIEVDGAERFRGRVEPDLEFLLRNYLVHRDRQLLYVAQVRIDLVD